MKAVGKTFKSATQLYKEIKLIEETGAWSVEVECVPSKVLEEISKNTSMVTISIGSGNKADVQFLFAEDILGYGKIKLPRHAKSKSSKTKCKIDNTEFCCSQSVKKIK